MVAQVPQEGLVHLPDGRVAAVGNIDLGEGVAGEIVELRAADPTGV